MLADIEVRISYVNSYTNKMRTACRCR